MFEALWSPVTVINFVLPADRGAGPEELIAGTAGEGYFGTIPAASFINGTDLAAAIGLTTGTVLTANINNDWMKFAWKGRIVYTPFKGYRSSVTWTQLYNLGAVYGSDTVGRYPEPTPVLQNARVIIGGKTYKVRLMKTLVTDDADLVVGTGSGSTGRFDVYPITRDSEYNQLMYRSSLDDPPQQVGDDWAAYTATELNAGWIICQEASSRAASFLVRGYMGYGIGSAWCLGPRTLVASSIVWKPVLELDA